MYYPAWRLNTHELLSKTILCNVWLKISESPFQITGTLRKTSGKCLRSYHASLLHIPPCSSFATNLSVIQVPSSCRNILTSICSPIPHPHAINSNRFTLSWGLVREKVRKIFRIIKHCLTLSGSNTSARGPDIIAHGWMGAFLAPSFATFSTLAGLAFSSEENCGVHGTPTCLCVSVCAYLTCTQKCREYRKNESTNDMS